MKERTLILSNKESMKVQCDFYRNWSDKYVGPKLQDTAVLDHGLSCFDGLGVSIFLQPIFRDQSGDQAL